MAAQREREAPPSYDRSLRAKLQRRYQALATRNKRPVTPLPSLPDVQCLGTIADGLPRGRSQLLEIIQQAMMVGDPLAKDWWTVYADLTPEERKVVNLDEVGLAAGVDYAAFVGTLVTVNTRLGADTRQLVFESVQVSTILAAAANATLPADHGFPDRQMLLQGSGLVPAPKSHTTQVTVTATAQAAAAAQTEAAGRGLGFLDDVAGAEEARGAVQTQLIEEAKPTEPVFEGVTVEREKVPVAATKEGTS